MKAYHFVSDTLRDGSSIPADGEKLIHQGQIELCNSGYHWSKHPLDALTYAPGFTVCLVEVGGDIIEGHDKGVSTERTIIRRVDVKDLVLKFARDQALKVIHLWDAPEVVKEFLETGNEDLAARAARAAEAAARAAETSKGANAARAAAWAAAKDAAWAAAWAAGAAAEAAAKDAAWAAAWAADKIKKIHRDEFKQLIDGALGYAA